MGVSAGRVWTGSGGGAASSAFRFILGARTPSQPSPFEAGESHMA